MVSADYRGGGVCGRGSSLLLGKNHVENVTAEIQASEGSGTFPFTAAGILLVHHFCV